MSGYNDPTIDTLGGVLAGVGSNLLANQIQGWKDHAEAAQKLAQGLPEEMELRAELDAILEKLDALGAAQSALPEAERPGFTQQVQAELAQVGSRLKVEIVTVGYGVYVKGEGAVGVGAGGMYFKGNAGGHVLGPGATLVEAPDPRQVKAEEQASAKARYLQRFYRRCSYLPLARRGRRPGQSVHCPGYDHPA